MALQIISTIAMAIFAIAIFFGLIAFGIMIYHTFKDLNKWE